MTAVGDARTSLDTIDGLLVDAEGAITRAQDILRRVLHVDEEIVDEQPEAGEWVTVSPDDERIVAGSRVRVWEGCYAPYTVVTVAAAEPVTGEWVMVRPDDPRIKDGSRVRLGGVEGEALRFPRRLRACGPSRELWSADHGDGPDVELWVHTEVTLPLPTEPGPFWGRVERDGDTYTGWVWRGLIGNYLTPRDVGCFRAHHAEHVTRLPLPDAEREALR